MDRETQQQLLILNREFYATVAEPFDSTRLAPSAGKSELVRRLPLAEIAKRYSEESASQSAERCLQHDRAGGFVTPKGSLCEPSKEGIPRFAQTDTLPTLADIGCGNGRLAWLLEERGVPLEYVGVDANAQLLVLAQEHTAKLRCVRARFVQADLAQPDWPASLLNLSHESGHDSSQGFDIITCLATLHHLPGYELRCATMQRLARLVQPGGIVAISTWQFLTSPRFIAKQVDWAAVGIDPARVEAGDALLPWQQGRYAVRYVHQIDIDEVSALANAAGLTIESTYFADGKEGNLNLYAILHRPDTGSTDKKDRA